MNVEPHQAIGGGFCFLEENRAQAGADFAIDLLPLLISRENKISNLVQRNTARWTNILSIEMGFEIENHNISSDLLLLFTEDSIASLEQRLPFAFG